MKKKGFTLIELLAVIVILVVIALIATPIIINIIEKSKKSAFEDSVYGVMEAAKLKYTESIVNGNIQEKTYVIEDGLQELEYSGKVDGKGVLKIDKTGKIELAIHNDKWCIKKGLEDSDIMTAEFNESCIIEIPVERAIANEPNLANGLIPVKWNGRNWEKADSTNPSTNLWYDYDKQMWANAVSVTESYRDVEIGTVIPAEEIQAYFVWIPRYEYDYTDLATKTSVSEIKINFIAGTETKATSNYMIHPAFTFGDQELEGIWVGKFETTGDAANPTIKPNTGSLTNQYVDTQFATAQKFSASGNPYGIETLADSHMMKNSEWGAVAYLSQSKYGKYGNENYTGENKEIYINNHSNHGTGCSAGSPSAEKSSKCAYTYEKENTGTGASTTGTIYGVYDMNGLEWEYVMGNFNATIGLSGFSSLPEEKYYDKYTNTISDEVCSNGICYGHALSETAGWNQDSTTLVSSSRPWIIRGGTYGNAKASGIFAYLSHDGDGYPHYSFRVVLL